MTGSTVLPLRLALRCLRSPLLVIDLERQRSVLQVPDAADMVQAAADDSLQSSPELLMPRARAPPPRGKRAALSSTLRSDVVLDSSIIREEAYSTPIGETPVSDTPIGDASASMNFGVRPRGSGFVARVFTNASSRRVASGTSDAALASSQKAREHADREDRLAASIGTSRDPKMLSTPVQPLRPRTSSPHPSSQQALLRPPRRRVQRNVPAIVTVSDTTKGAQPLPARQPGADMLSV
eukprot:gene33773-21110_t